MSYKDIKERYCGKFGVFTHDMYKCSDEDMATCFIAAFDDFPDALRHATGNRAIHII